MSLFKQPVVRSLALGALAAIAVQLPLIGLAFALLAAPLLMIVPDLGTTGPHVDVGFAWIRIKSPFAWAAFIAYFSALFGALLALYRAIRSQL